MYGVARPDIPTDLRLLDLYSDPAFSGLQHQPIDPGATLLSRGCSGRYGGTMAAHKDDSMANRGGSRGGSEIGSGTGPGTPSKDAVSRALAEVEQTLERLKVLRDERTQAEERYKTELTDRDRRIEALQTQYDEAQLASDDLREQLTTAENTAKEHAETLQATINTLEAHAAETKQEVEAQQARADDAQSRAAALQSRAEDYAREAQDASRRAEETLAQLTEANSRLDTLEQSLAAKTSEADEARHNASILSEKVAEQETALTRLQAELAEAQATADEHTRKQAEHEASTDSELTDLLTEIDRLETEAVGLREACDNATSASREAEQRTQAAEAALEALQRESDQLASTVHAELTEALDTEREHARELNEKLERAADHLLDLQAALDTWERNANEAGSQASAQISRDEEGVAALTDQLNTLRDPLHQAQLERDHARQELDQRADDHHHPAEPWDDEKITLRQRRLRRYRALLRSHAQKVMAGEEILVQRIKMCDEMLSRRRELAEARQIIERTHKKIASGRARSGAAAAIFFGLAIVTVLSGLSWTVVTRVFPPTYAASAIIGADFNGTPPAPGEVEAWQTFHQQLLLDPNIMVRVGERMKQRGFVELSHPAAVKAMLETDMTWTTPEPSKLAIEMRSQGREAATRKLDTYVTTLTVEANALRQRRSETSTSVVLERAKAGVEPIDDERLQQAAIGVAGGTLLSFLLWFGLWHRMVKSKAAFENTTEIEGLLEEARWVDPIEKIMNGRDQENDNKAA